MKTLLKLLFFSIFMGMLAISVSADKKDPCIDIKNEIYILLGDLSTQKKVKKIVKRSIKVHFDLECGVVHFDIINSFIKNNILNDKYQNFLLKELKKIDSPCNDNRAYSIFKYLESDGVINPDEWEIGLKTIQKVEKQSLSNYLSILLFAKNNENNEILAKRIDEFLSLAEECKLGTQEKISFADAFSELEEALNYKNSKNKEILDYIHEKYKSVLPEPKQENIDN